MTNDRNLARDLEKALKEGTYSVEHDCATPSYYLMSAGCYRATLHRAGWSEEEIEAEMARMMADFEARKAEEANE